MPLYPSFWEGLPTLFPWPSKKCYEAMQQVFPGITWQQALVDTVTELTAAKKCSKSVAQSVAADEIRILLTIKSLSYLEFLCYSCYTLFWEKWRDKEIKKD